MKTNGRRFRECRMTCFIAQTLLCVLLATLWGLTASAETPQTDSGDRDAAAGNERVATRPATEKAFVSFRIAPDQWRSDGRFRELLDLFEKHKGVTDEITFFFAGTVCPVPLEVARKHADILTRRMAEARSKGYSAGINVLATLGHVAAGPSTSLSGPYTPVTGIQGDVCRGSICPNDENAREYIRQLYTIVTQAKPDYIWIDDDVRMAWHPPVLAGCFCDRCLYLAPLPS